MRNAAAQHLGVLTFTLRRLAKTPLFSFLSIVVIGVALSLPVGVYVLVKNVQNLAENFAGAPQISVFLEMNTSKEEISRIGKRLKEHGAVDFIEFVPRDLALKQLEQSAGLADVAGGLTKNPLPDAFIIHPVEMDSAKLELLRDDLKTWPKFDSVQLDSVWVKKLEAILAFARLALWIVALLLGFGLIVITFNTIRLQILTQRDEIEVSKLIGASNGFIRRPFLYFGVVQGVLGGAAAWLVVTASLSALNQNLANLSQIYATSLMLQYLSVVDGLILIGISAYLGWFGAWLSTSQYLWKIEPR